MLIYVDTADLSEIEEWAHDPRISGITTNPTLMKAAGVESPLVWAKLAVRHAHGKPISIDGPVDTIWGLGENVIPKVTRIPYAPIYSRPVNLTAVCTEMQARTVYALPRGSIISVFAGRIMDTGRSPIPVIDAAKATRAQVLWASVREPYNIVQAERAGCDIVTVPPAILRKYFDWKDRSLDQVAEQTIAQFQEDQVPWT